MRKKPFIVIIVLFFIHTSFSSANMKNLSVEAHYVSRYIWRGFDATPDNNTAFQPSLRYSFAESGLWVNLWGSIGLTERNKIKTADEVDYVFGYDKSLAGGIIDFSAGMYYYTFPNLEGNNATPEVFISIALNKIPLSPSFSFYHDMDIADGQYLLFSVSRTMTAIPLVLGLSAGYNNNYSVNDSGISDIILSFSYNVTLNRITLIPALYFALTPMESVNKDGSEIWFSIGFSF